MSSLALSLFAQLSGAIQTTATQTSRQPYVLHLLTRTPLTWMTSVTDTCLQMFFKCTTLYHWKISGSLAQSISPSDHYFSGLHCKSHARCITKKQIIKLTALTLGKVCEELSNTLMLTPLQSLYLNNSPSS